MSVSARTAEHVAVSGTIVSQPSGVLDHNGTRWTPTRNSPAARSAAGLAKAALVRGQALAGAVRGGPPRPGLRILYYHRISDERDPLAVAPGRLPAADGRARGQRAARRRPLRDRRVTLAPGEAAVALTFDDGYRDVLEHGAPGAARARLPEHGLRRARRDRRRSRHSAGTRRAACRRSRAGTSCARRSRRASCTSSRTRSRTPS